MYMKQISNKFSTGLWLIPFTMLLTLTLMIGCTKHELIDLPNGDVEGSIVFADIDYYNYQYPGILFRIKAQSDSNTFWTSSDKNGKFSFPDLPPGGYNFTLIENNKEIMNIKHCSFLGGGEPSALNFWYHIQPDIKSIDYHFELVNDAIWMIGKVELDGIPPIECNKIMLYVSVPPNNSQYFSAGVPFDLKTNQIKYKLFTVFDLKSGDYFNSYIYKRYKDYGALFSNYVIKEGYSMSQYDRFSSSFKTASDSTSTYKFIIP